MPAKKIFQNSMQKAILITVFSLFAVFLLLPMVVILWQSFWDGNQFSWQYYQEIWADSQIGTAFWNSVRISGLSGLLTTFLAFGLAYTVHYTNLRPFWKKIIISGSVLPMLLPTITYGFAIIYSFGKQGLLTMLWGRQFFDIYGIVGLLIGYVIYTLPVAFLLIHNTMGYIDKKFMIVSRAMGDSAWRNFYTTVFIPLLGTLAAAFIQSFTLSFTDYGIPASVGGNMPLIASALYNEMLGSLPNFHTGSVVAVMMLLPSVVSIFLLSYLERYNIRYNKVSVIDLEPNGIRDFIGGLFSLVVLGGILSIFAVIFVVPFVNQWPYDLSFSFFHVQSVLADPALMKVFRNSLLVAVLTAICGTLVVYSAALLSARNGMSRRLAKPLDSIALVTNTIPGMVLGVAYLLAFKGTFLQNTLAILIFCNVVHFFSSPYLMMKNGLEKMNLSWETTAKLMGDNWIKTVVRIITPNGFPTLVEVCSYYFINAMVTVSAIIFIAGAKTMVMTAKIKELQHFANFNEIFVLSIFILLTNLLAKGLFQSLLYKKNKNER